MLRYRAYDTELSIKISDYPPELKNKKALRYHTEDFSDFLKKELVEIIKKIKTKDFENRNR